MSTKRIYGKFLEALQRKHATIIPALFLIVACIFLALRLIPISQETVPYTYDQGRDFRAARDIVVDRNLTLIGPTTGAGGVFHGAWWYYFLTIPFMLTGGTPLAFYYFITLSAFVQGVLFYRFLSGALTRELALLWFAIVAISSYFIRMSIFAISSIMTMPFILLLMYSLYHFIRTQSRIYLAVAAFSIGMIFEGEVAFGLILLPASILAVFLAREMKLFFGSVWNLIIIAGSFCAAIIFRIVFELKYGFMQTKALLLFRTTPGTHDVGIQTAFFERLELFSGYYEDMFGKLKGLGWILLGVAIYGLYKGYSKLSQTHRRFVNVLCSLIGSLFAVSLLYNKNFFWANYFEGIHYMLLVFVMYGLYAFHQYNKDLARKVIGGYIALCVIAGGMFVASRGLSRDDVKNEGLRMHTRAVDYVHDQVGSNPYCLRIYTPPVIPHTYSYLLDLHARTQDMTYPRTVYRDGECWYLIESDAFDQRRADWLKSNIPADARKTHEHWISNHLVIQRWEY